MELTDKEVALLRRIVTEDAIELLYRMANGLIHNWNNPPLPTESEWECVRESIKREERKNALVTFMEQIKKSAHNG